MTTVCFLDVETSFSKDEYRNMISSPFFGQQLVSVGYQLWNMAPPFGPLIIDSEYIFFNHNSVPNFIDGFKILQDALDKTDILVGHNIKFDLMWLRECGFKYNKKLYCTMVAEYVLLRSKKLPLSLAECCKRRGIQEKNAHILDEHLSKDVSFEDIPPEIVEEYGANDVEITKQLADHQLKSFKFTWWTYYNDPVPAGREQGLICTLSLSNDLTNVLTDVERNGIKISNRNLRRIKFAYEEEYASLGEDLQKIIEQVMGDTPINLESPDDRSLLVYSRKVSDKEEWKEAFNLGWEVNGNTKRQKFRRRMSRRVFVDVVKRLAPVQRKTQGKPCSECGGHGRKKAYTKAGKISKIQKKCAPCGGVGVIYTDLPEAAGLKVVPRNPYDVASAGFKTDKQTLMELSYSQEGVAKEFIDKYMRYSQIRTYLNTFVESLESYQDEECFIHPQFMQCVTSTGRLSSRAPNFQNMPRGSTFPAREAIVSRFDGGYILEGDYRQLEFRVAGFLSGDKQIYEDVKNGIDVHSYTADIMGVDRQSAKAHTFKPLYGGTKGTRQEMRYYDAFKAKYNGVTSWHERLQREAVNKKKVTLPSGREYSFPNAKFNRSGTAVGATAIKNYPVQGFATADILPLALINMHKKLDNFKSVVINTVHDSIVVDVHPNEKDEVIQLLRDSMLSIKDECSKRYLINFDMPIDIELKIGNDWLNLKEI
jgi:DNA polymerase I-like protein with 3'-5' exonuclease and polymerase domains